MYGCESWTIRKAECRRIDAFKLWCWRRLLRVPLTARRSNQSILKEISPEYSLEKTDAEAETPILWPPDAKNWLTWKDPDAGKYWRQEEKGITEDETVGWHHWLDGHELKQALGVGDGQGSLVCCSSWGQKELDTTERQNWTELNQTLDGGPLASGDDPNSVVGAGGIPGTKAMAARKWDWKQSQKKHPVLMSRLTLVTCSSVTRACTLPHSVCLRSV